MSALRHALALRQLSDTDAAWRLLRAAHAPIIAALLQEHLGGETRRLPAAELYEIIDNDLEELRAHGIDLPLHAHGYCGEWRAAGFLVRRAADGARGETFELSPGALTAIRFLAQLESPTQSVTESRLSSISAQLSQLAIDSDPDATRRLEQLHAQRDRIEQQIARIHEGELDVLGDDRASERLRDILAQAIELPSDFARVRARFEELNRDLRARILESEANQKVVLDEIFRNVDVIATSDEGRTFAGFSALLLDPALGAAFDDDVARVLKRDFATELSASERRFLRRFVAALGEHSAEIHDVITAFARGLRRYVHSQDYQRDRVLRQLLADAQSAGVEAAQHTKPYAPTRIRLELSAVTMSSIGAMRLHDPADITARAPIVVHSAEPVDLEALRALARETEIDYAELTHAVNDVLAHTASCTVGEVLAHHPATQGVASVVGLLSLAAQQGTAGDSVETVSWTGTDGIDRAARIRTHRFFGRIT